MNIRFLITCPLCLGKTTIGNCSMKKDCPECGASGHLSKSAEELTPQQATAARLALTEAPPDADEQYITQSTAEHLTSLLSSRWTETIRLPDGDAVHIDLVSKRGNAIRIFPEFHQGKFRNLNAIPVPPVTTSQ
jgi:hypothetical protein